MMRLTYIDTDYYLEIWHKKKGVRVPRTVTNHMVVVMKTCEASRRL